MIFSAAINLCYLLASKGAAFTSFKLSLLTLAIPQRDYFSFLTVFFFFSCFFLLFFYFSVFKWILIFFHTEFVHRYVMSLLFPYIFCDRCIIQSHCAHIIPFCPEMSVSIFIFQICMSIKYHQCRFPF